MTKEEIKLFTSPDPATRAAYQRTLHGSRIPYGKTQPLNPNAARGRKPHWTDGKTMESRYIAAEEARIKALYGQQ